MKLFEDLKAAIAEVETDANKFYNKGNSAAGTRVRAGMQKIKKIASDIRIDVQSRKNADKG